MMFERFGVVTDLPWLRSSVEVASLMMPCAVRVFHTAERQQAIDWLASPPRSALCHRILEDEGVLILEPTAPLTTEDFDAVLTFVEPWTAVHGQLSGIIIQAHAFPGWESFGGMLRHLSFSHDHHLNVDRVALVSDAKLAEILPQLVDQFFTAEVKQFDEDALDYAINWASGGKERRESAAAATTQATPPV